MSGVKHLLGAAKSADFDHCDGDKFSSLLNLKNIVFKFATKRYISH
jgi:hypothetical protein